MSLLARLPTLEWCHRTAAGQHADLAWVDGTVEVHRETFGAVETPEGVRFQHVPYAGFQPPSMLEAQQQAQARGAPTLQEALLLLFARAEWLVATRERWWTPLTPTPASLAPLVEVYGIERALHRSDAAALARLVALLPSWYPGRGTVAAAERVLVALESGPLPEVRSLQQDGPAPACLVDEVFVCRSVEFWEARWTDGASTSLRIQGGVLLFQAETPGVVLRREDVAIAWSPTEPANAALARLLPPWTLFRPFLAAEPT